MIRHLYTEALSLVFCSLVRLLLPICLLVEVSWSLYLLFYIDTSLLDRAWLDCWLESYANCSACQVACSVVCFSLSSCRCCLLSLSHPLGFFSLSYITKGFEVDAVSRYKTLQISCIKATTQGWVQVADIGAIPIGTNPLGISLFKICLGFSVGHF